MGQSRWYDEDFDHSIWRSNGNDYENWHDKEDKRWRDSDDEPKHFGGNKLPSDEIHPSGGYLLLFEYKPVKL